MSLVVHKLVLNSATSQSTRNVTNRQVSAYASVSVWQHVDCMEIDRNNIPDEYLCEACDPRPVDRVKAQTLQVKRREEIRAHLARLSSSDSEDNAPATSKPRQTSKNQERKNIKKKKTKQVKETKNPRKNSKKTVSSSSHVTNTVSAALSTEHIIEEKDRRGVKLRKRKSSTTSDLAIEDVTVVNSLDNMLSWIDSYEEAVTNHYSPELRARVHSARINGISEDLKASAQSAILEHRCKVIENEEISCDIFQSKILVAAAAIQAKTAVIEYQGKYLLMSQWNSQQALQGGPQKFMPFVLIYEMPKEGLSVCIDARTYGNKARFARKSCRPNTEIRHVIERGSLHLYIVATEDLEEDEEILLPLETTSLFPDAPCSGLPPHFLSCKSSPKKLENNYPVTPDKTGSPLSKKVKKLSLQLTHQPTRINKRSVSVDSYSNELTNITSPESMPSTPIKQRRSSGCNKSPLGSPTSEETSPITPETPDKGCQHKMTREERKIAAYIKAFERLEKQAQKKQEMEKRREIVKERKKSEGNASNTATEEEEEEEEEEEKTSSADESMKSNGERRKKGRKGKSKSPQKRSGFYKQEIGGSETAADEISVMSTSTLSYDMGPGTPVGYGGCARFPKTKKALMNEWLNETVDPVNHSSGSVPLDIVTGVPTCYMRNTTNTRRPSGSGAAAQSFILTSSLELQGGSAKKRWLRQAIEESEPHSCSGNLSPNGHPDSPTSTGEYNAPLKKRRLARESMSSEHSATSPSTPVYFGSIEDDKEVESVKVVVENLHSEDEADSNGRLIQTSEDIKKEELIICCDDALLVINEDENPVLNIPRTNFRNVKAIKKKKVLRKKRLLKTKHSAQRFKSRNKCSNSSSNNEIVLKDIKSEDSFELNDSATDTLNMSSNEIDNVMSDDEKIKVDINKNIHDQVSDINKTVDQDESEECQSCYLDCKPVQLEKSFSPIELEFSHRGPSTPDGPVPSSGESSPTKLENSTAHVTEEKLSSSPSENIVSSDSADVSETSCNNFESVTECTGMMSESSKSVVCKKPATKRKLSILEYRKRKSVSCDSEVSNPKSNEENVKNYENLKSPVHLHSPEDVALPFSFHQPFESTEYCDNSSVDENKECYSNKSTKEVHWDDKPTLLEMQRENLTERLRREFGLCVSDDNQGKTKSSLLKSEQTSKSNNYEANNFQSTDEKCHELNKDGIKLQENKCENKSEEEAQFIQRHSDNLDIIPSALTDNSLNNSFEDISMIRKNITTGSSVINGTITPPIVKSPIIFDINSAPSMTELVSHYVNSGALDDISDGKISSSSSPEHYPVAHSVSLPCLGGPVTPPQFCHGTGQYQVPSNGVVTFPNGFSSSGPVMTVPPPILVPPPSQPPVTISCSFNTSGYSGVDCGLPGS